MNASFSRIIDLVCIPPQEGEGSDEMIARPCSVRITYQWEKGQGKRAPPALGFGIGV